MTKYKDPKWWSKDYDSSWQRPKAAFERDWDQTKHDFGGDEPDTNQSVGTTVAQATGKKTIPPRGVPNYEEAESAYRYGYGARKHYGNEYPEWDSQLESRLEKDWKDANPGADQSYDTYRLMVRHGWESENVDE